MRRVFPSSTLDGAGVCGVQLSYPGAVFCVLLVDTRTFSGEFEECDRISRQSKLRDTYIGETVEWSEARVPRICLNAPAAACRALFCRAAAPLYLRTGSMAAGSS